MAQLFLAVDHMHKYNVIHRDLKPENILLDKDGALKISNFWLATIAKDGELLTSKCVSLSTGYLACQALYRGGRYA